MEPVPIPQRRLNILFADWDPRVRECAVRELAAAGHSVFEAADGKAAWYLGETLSRPLHLLITDAILTPGCNGFDLARHMQVMRPGLPVLYLCDIPSDEGVRRDLEEGLVSFLSKPFDGTRLRSKVEALARGPVRRNPFRLTDAGHPVWTDPGVRLVG